MEREWAGQEPKIQRGFRDKLATAVRVTRTLIWGLGISSYFGFILLMIRMPHSRWRGVPMIVFMLAITLNLFRKDKEETGQFLWFVLCLCFIPLYLFRSHEWVPLAIGAMFAGYFWLRFKSTGRPYLFMLSGALLAGVLPLNIPWPNEQRCLLTLVGVGLTAILQGAWIIIRYLQGDRPAELVDPAKMPNAPLDGGLTRFIYRTFGTVEHVQILSSELEMRIRKRYQLEISQLTDLGFDYLFSDGEAFSLFRLALILPALTVILMLRKGEVVTVHEGLKLMAGHPVYISRNKTAFAEPSGLGVKFYTALQNGSLLISKDYDDEDLPTGPMIAAYARKASISDTWADHQKRIEALEAAGKRVNQQYSFQAYAEIEDKESANY